jgi:hypothetical protein
MAAAAAGAVSTGVVVRWVSATTGGVAVATIDAVGAETVGVEAGEGGAVGVTA